MVQTDKIFELKLITSLQQETDQKINWQGRDGEKRVELR